MSSCKDRPAPTHLWGYLLGEKEGLMWGHIGASANTKALFFPLHPPGGLKFSSHCSVLSYIPLPSLGQGGDLCENGKT